MESSADDLRTPLASSDVTILPRRTVQSDDKERFERFEAMAERRVEPLIPGDRESWALTRQLFGIDSTLCLAASHSNYFEALRALWAGASVDAVFSARSALSTACQSGCVEIAELLLDRGACVDGVPEDVGPRQEEVDAGATEAATSLFCACAGGHIETVQLLLSRGASIDREFGFRGLGAPRDSANGSLALLYVAIRLNSTEIAGVLLDSGAKVNMVKDKHGCHLSPLMFACHYSSNSADRGIGMVGLLLDRGAEINQRHPQNNDISALFLSCSNDDIALTRFLLTRGAVYDDHAAIRCARRFASFELNKLFLRFFLYKWRLWVRLGVIGAKTTTQFRVLSDGHLMSYLISFLIGPWIIWP